MSAATLLERLDGVKKTGPDRWVARCVVHEDRSPSVSVRELPDGRVLVHCFAGCKNEEILDAIGLHWSALFPTDWAGKDFRRAPGIPASDVLRCVAGEVTLVLLIARDMEQGLIPAPKDIERLAVANRRIQAALETINVRSY
jgi:hypothetical protein